MAEPSKESLGGRATLEGSKEPFLTNFATAWASPWLFAAPW